MNSLVMIYCAFRQAPPSRATVCTTSEANIKLAEVLAAVRLCLFPYLESRNRTEPRTNDQLIDHKETNRRNGRR